MTAARPAVWRAFAIAALRLAALFALVFYGVDELTARRAAHWLLYADWELRIPYWPAAFPVYFSVFALPFLLPWLAGQAQPVRQWERRMAAAIAIAGALFLLLPAQLGYAAADAGAWMPWARLAQAVAGRYNLLPSLHVALSGVTLMTLWPLAPRGLRGWLLGWWLLLLASVLLTHQHHLLDVLAGALLAWLLGRKALGRTATRAPT